MLTNKRLILAHFWLAFIVFGAALVLGAWQMFVRSPLNAWHFNPEFYYRSVTAHGSAMGYVFPTLIAMGFGYAITEHWTAMLTFDHLSNGHYIFGINCAGNTGPTPNPGINNWGGKIGYAF